LNNPGRYRWHLALVGVLLLFYFVPQQTVERFYSGWIYLKFHAALYWIFGWIPIPGLYIILVLIFLVLMKWVLILLSADPLLSKVTRITGHVAKWTVWFFVLWGFNYNRVPLEEKLQLEIRPLSASEMQSEIVEVSDELLILRKHMENDTVPIAESWFEYKNSANDKLIYTLRQWGYPPVRVKGQEIKEDLLLRFDVGGIYMPYTGEANIDAGVHYYSKPFYMLHEMSHANGFCDEATCNFIAYVVGTAFADEGFQYSAQVSYLRYLLADLVDMDSVAGNAQLKQLPALVRFDIELLKQHAKLHTFKTSPIGEVINNRYLKWMGIEEGTRSYNKMVQWVYAWRQSQPRRLKF
jgi:Protein of unknown function (DUF3810)